MTRDELRIRADVTGRAATLILDGELDANTAPVLVPEVARLVTSGVSVLRLDASLVEFVDSSGLGALVGAQRTARTAGADVELIPSVRLRQLLTRIGLLSYFGLATR